MGYTGIMRPELVDNRNGNTLAAALSGYVQWLEAEDRRIEEFCLATGFFNLAGFKQVMDWLATVPRVRMLLGVEPRPEAERPETEPGQSAVVLTQDLLEEQVRLLQEGLCRQRDLLPFDRKEDESVRRLLQLLDSGQVEVRRCAERVLHAKAFLFRTSGAGVLVGSSNLTWGGLVGNLELNLGHYDPSLVDKVWQWFEELWALAEPFDLAQIYDRLLEEFPPFWIYLRVLYELYGAQLAEQEKEEPIPLTMFQKHGVWRAMRIMEQYGGAMVADGVGLGKTYLAGEIARQFIERRQRVLLICPAALRDSTWQKFLGEYQLFVEKLSFEQLGEERQLGGSRPYLQRGLEEYALVIVDEAHHYRNPGTPKRAEVFRRLLSKGKYPKLLLLTATPVNNSLWDLYYLLRYFLRQDAALASRGVLSIRERFQQAMAEDPFNLEPDLLYPILDATTVKRTRGFIQREYPNEQIQLPDGRWAIIRFPKPVLRTIRYKNSEQLDQLLEKLELELAPEDGVPGLTMARYQPEQYLKPEYRREDLPSENPVVGLLRSALLKRFESSVGAFRQTVERMIAEHKSFLTALDQGKVLRKEALQEVSEAMNEQDDEEMEALIADMPGESDVRYKVRPLKEAVQGDLLVLEQWRNLITNVGSDEDPKLAGLAAELARIVAEALRNAVDEEDERRKRKVIIFSAFEDTIDWIERFLQKEVKRNSRLRVYEGRIVSISGRESRNGVSREDAIYHFAPSGAPGPNYEDRYDILLSTDVISEGMNLQDCCNIINYDLPWNPMRLIQRHGRVDRITSPHEKIFLQSFFPADELEKLLELDQRICRKLAQAAASVGVETPPIAAAPKAERSFSESRQEIDRIFNEDAGLLEEGTLRSAALSSEEHRAVLRKALKKYGDQIRSLPWKAGSGMLIQGQPGYVFLARVGHPKAKLVRTFLRFVPFPQGEIIREVGTCLRLIQCTEDTPRVLPDNMRLAAFDAWQQAREDIWQEWRGLTDPANLQPRLHPLNHQVAEFLRQNPPPKMSQEQVERVIDCALSPWSFAQEREIRMLFEDPAWNGNPRELAPRLAEKMEELGIEPFQPPEPFPPIQPGEIHLVCWLVLVKES